MVVDFSFVDSCLSYANIASVSSSQKKLNKIQTKQKHAVQTMSNVNQESHTKAIL